MIQTHNITQDWAFKEAFEVWKTQKSKQKCRQETQKTNQKQNKTKKSLNKHIQNKAKRKKENNWEKKPIILSDISL